MKIYFHVKSNGKITQADIYQLVDTVALNKLMLPNGLLTTSLNTAAQVSQASPLHFSRVSMFLKTLNCIVKERNKEAIHTLLTKSPSELSVFEVVIGLKQLEDMIYYRSNVERKDNISMNFRWFLSSFGGKVLDKRTISQCGFKTRFKTGGDLSRNMSPSSITSAIPFIFKTERKKNIEYFTIDPDWLNGLASPMSLLGNILSNAAASSHESPLARSTIVTILTVLEKIANSQNATDIHSLLSKTPNSISEQNVIQGFIQIEDLIQEKEISKQSGFLLRTFLNKWGETLSHDKNIIKSGFKSRFIYQTRTLACIEPLFIKVSQQTKSISTITKHYVNTFYFVSLTPPDSLMSVALLNAEEASKNSPLKLSSIKKLEQVLLLLSTQATWKVKRLLTTNPSKITLAYVNQGFRALESIIQKNCPKNEHASLSRIFRQFLSNYGGTLADGKTIAQCKFKTQFLTNQKPNITLSFKIKVKKNGIYTYSQCSLNLSELEGLYTAKGLLGVALNNAARSSWSDPIFRSNLDLFWRVAKKVAKHDNIILRTLLITPPNQVTRQNLIKGFQLFEEMADSNKDWTNKYSISNIFRSFLSVWTSKLSNNLTILQCRFKTKFKKIIPEKQLIDPLDENGEVKPSPVLLRHQSLSELKTIISDYYNDAIQQILDACADEMALYRRLRDEIAPLIEMVPSSEENLHFQYEVAKEIILYTDNFKNKNTTYSKMLALIERYGKHQVLAGALQSRLKTPLTSPFYFTGQSHVIPDYVQAWFPKSGLTPDFVWSGTLLPRQILLVCFIRIVIFTTWNKDVVATLRPEDLPTELPDSSFIFQGYKDKVDKLTAKVTVHPHDHEIREVINLLIVHIANMKALGASPQTIWETRTSVQLTFLSKTFIESLCKRSSHPTPLFTLEQLAKHQINLRYKIDDNLEKSQQERNHSKAKTTAGYMLTPLARIEYEANNAEFQRRLEATVQFRHSDENALTTYNMDPRDIDLNLLASPDPSDEDSTKQLPIFLLGDGSSCANIWAPIDTHNLEQDICRGRKCHSEGGCIYNKIILGAYEFSFTLRKCQWFITRGELLLEKYDREYFDTYIAPEMIFVFGLTRYVEKVNPPLYREAQKLLIPTEEVE